MRHRYVSNCFLAKNDIERPRKTKRPRNRFKKIGPRHVLHKRNPHCCDTIEDLRNEYGLKGLRHELKQKNQENEIALLHFPEKGVNAKKMATTRKCGEEHQQEM